MRTFVQKPSQPQKQTSSSFIPAARPSQHTSSFQQASSITDNQTGRQTLGSQAESKSRPNSLAAAPVHHFDFARIPILPAAIQRKPVISSPGDPLEREADSVADQVIHIGESKPVNSVSALIQRQCVGCEDDKEEAHLAEQATSASAATPPFAVQSIEGQEDEEQLFTQPVIFRKAKFTAPRITGAMPAITNRLLQRSGGEPLSTATRRNMENAMGYDFSGVRVHRDAEAGAMSHQLSAKAFTHRNNIFFGNGMYRPDGVSGRRLLAHELTHVVQQGRADRKSTGKETHSTTRGIKTPTLANQASIQMIQRVATWSAGTVHEVNNLASAIMNGTSVGFTPPMLNNAIVLSTANTRAAITRPTLNFAAVPNGGGVNATVTTVPTNTGSFDETVLAAGPWTVNAPKATVGARYPALVACTGAGNSTFSAIGMPNDAAMFAANRRHEDHHATDHQAAFNGSIVPWDTRLTAAQTAGTTYNGATNADAETALYTAMGNTPDQVADAYFNECVRLNNVYHGTPAGGNVTENNPTANADCSTSSVEATNPS